ncbi:MAG: putative DNA binding domain-containing protein [Methanosarcinales archaeon]|nr:putative DNA binding domain-containing protein [Methanosarcinales archaeon]
MKESNRIEHKRELTNSLEKEVVAFLNYREGGHIYIGVDDATGTVVGVSNPDAVQLKIKDRIKNNIMPSALGIFDVIAEQHDAKTVIKITVASGSEKPYYLKKQGMSERGCFIRIGSASEPMPVRMIEDLFSRRIRNSIGTIKSRKKDLTFEQLKIYYSETPLKLNDKFAHDLELLTEDGELNYAAYLLSDSNGLSIKVAKYSSLDRVDLIENEEYGYCSLIKATKQVLAKLEIENKTFAKITPQKRQERKLIGPVALREAVINAIIHNNYTNEIPPKFELFPNRLEITSAGGLPPEFDENEFFMGYSVPRNKELMRIFKDLEMVEYLGSGVPRILRKYPRSIFTFTPNFIRITFPFAEGVVGGQTALTDQATEQATMHATMHATMQAEKVIQFCIEPRSRNEIQLFLDLKNRDYFHKKILNPLIKEGKLALTIPDKPKSPKQRYITRNEHKGNE